jgi:hypothetical protein
VSTAPVTLTSPAGTDTIDPGVSASQVLSQPRSQITTDLWAAALILQLQADGYNVPLTQNNVTNIETWMAAESTPSGWLTNNDPLNLRNTQEGGAFSFDSVTAGVQATAATLTNGQNGYPAIVAALQQNASLPVFTSAVANSNWDQNHYAGTGFLAGSDGPLQAFATGTGGNPTGTLGQLEQTGEAATGAQLPSLSSWTTELGSLLGDLDSVTWWKRIGLFALGGAVLLVGLVVFVNSTQEGRKIETDAASAAVLA